MPINFKDLKGKASKAGPDRMKFVEGENRFRIVSDILAAYKYWLKDPAGNSIPMECLGFDREQEKFTNTTYDWVRHHFPDKRCSWAYSSYVIDRTDGKIKVLDHKKTLLQEILKAAKKLGDPTDLDNGWDIICTRTKTGPQAYNVEYSLEHFDLANSALTDEEKEEVAKLKPMDEAFPLPTPEQQKEFIENRILKQEDTDKVDEDVTGEFDDNIPGTEVSPETPGSDDIG